MPLPGAEVISRPHPEQVGQALHDRQAEPEAARPVTLGVVQLVELLEHARVLGLRNAAPGVGHRDDDVSASAATSRRMLPASVYLIALSTRLRTMRSSSRRSVSTTPSNVHVAASARPLACATGTNSCRRRSTRSSRLERRAIHLHDARVELRDVEQRVELRRHPLQRDVDVLRDLARARIEVAHRERSAEQRQRVDRLPEVVARRREEARLRAVRRLGALERRLQALGSAPPARSGFRRTRETAGTRREPSATRMAPKSAIRIAVDRSIQPDVGDAGTHRPHERERHDRRHEVAQQHRHVADVRRDGAGAEPDHDHRLDRALELGKEREEQQRQAVHDAVRDVQQDRDPQLLAVGVARQAAAAATAASGGRSARRRPAAASRAHAPMRHPLRRERRDHQRREEHRQRDPPRLARERPQELLLERPRRARRRTCDVIARIRSRLARRGDLRVPQ